MIRSGFKRRSVSEEKEKTSRADHHVDARLRRRCRLRVAGRRTNDWRKAWRFLKPRLEAAGRTYCEFDFIPHVCGGPLDPAHSKKRREMQGNDIYAVAMACRNIHIRLDYHMSHEEMETAVLQAINAKGGMILPQKEAA